MCGVAVAVVRPTAGISRDPPSWPSSSPELLQLVADGFAHAVIEDHVAAIAAQPFGFRGRYLDDGNVYSAEVAGVGAEDFDLVAEALEGMAGFADMGGGAFASADFYADIAADVENLHMSGLRVKGVRVARGMCGGKGSERQDRAGLQPLVYGPIKTHRVALGWYISGLWPALFCKSCFY